MAQCALCPRKPAPSSQLCRYHLTARSNLEKGYERWKKAYGGGMTWKEYLRRVSTNTATGDWAREVAEMLSKGAEEPGSSPG